MDADVIQKREAVLDRLSRSARALRTHVGSTSCFVHALEPLLERAP